MAQITRALLVIIAASSFACASPTAPSRVASTGLGTSTTALQGSSPFLRRSRFLAFGDSLTMGEVTSPGRSGTISKLIVLPDFAYPAQLLELLKAAYPVEADAFQVFNAGLSGEFAQDGVKRLPGVLEQTRPEVVLLLEGVNDVAVFREGGLLSAALAVMAMVETAKAHGAEVILATVPPSHDGGSRSVPATLLAQYNDLLHQVAAIEEVSEVDLFNGLAVDASRYIGIDGLHPNESGYRRMAELFEDTIRTRYEAQ